MRIQNSHCGPWQNEYDLFFSRYALHPDPAEHFWTATAPTAATHNVLLGGPVGTRLTCHILTELRHKTRDTEAFRLEEFIRMALAAQDDPRTVVTGPQATYWDAELTENRLLPGLDAHLAETRFVDWLAQQK
ncbi:hypothetical protein [Streptomyces sp. NPDC001604]|uniref:hypothetical protein n=1 Tax=Streptomyces sp. NPDC001604 TaxID=3364593 RepID=UPI00367B939C